MAEEESILFSDKTEKVVRMAIYNLSRYNDNGTFLQESVSRMRCWRKASRSSSKSSPLK